MKRFLSLILAAMLITAFTLSGGALAESTYDFVKATHNDVPIRALPDKSSKKLGEADKGEMFSCSGVADDDRGVEWYCINYGGSIGWISSNLSELYRYSLVTPGSGNTLKIINGSANVRAFPDVKAESVGIVSNGSTWKYGGLSVEDNRGVVWYRVVGKMSGWVSSKYSKVISSSGSESGGANTSGNTVTVTGSTVNVREKPSADAKLLGTVKKGVQFQYEGETKTDTKGTSWYKIWFSGSYGWISSKYSKLSSPTPASADAAKLFSVAGGAKITQSAYVKNNKPSVDGSKAFDGKTDTAWNVNTEDHSYGEWVEITAKKQCTVKGVTIVNGYNKTGSGTDAWEANSRVQWLSVYCDGSYVCGLNLADMRGAQKFTFASPLTGKTFRFVITDYYQGDKYNDVCISEISFF